MGKILLDHQKLLWHKERLKSWLAGERIAPITVDCALTRRCSYRCVYCYGQLQANQERPMTEDVIVRFLDDAAEIGVKAVSFVSDGESTCSPHLYTAITRGFRNGLNMALGTNGYLLKDEKLEECLPQLTYLRFNISAGTPESYAHIHGCTTKCFEKVVNTIRKAVEIKRRNKFAVTIGLQMVLMPQFSKEIMPLVALGKELGVDYLVIKHCSDDENGAIGVNYQQYRDLEKLLKEAEAQSTDTYQVSAKWSKIMSDGKRNYTQCYGPPFLIQLSGSGLVAPCGMFFNDKYSRYHIGNIVDTPFKELVRGERYWEVMNLIASPEFNAHTMCGCLCLQHKINEFLNQLKQNPSLLEVEPGPEPMHVNFI